MIHAEISIYPIATKTTSTSFYIAKAIESITDVECHLTPMGTILESMDLDAINRAIQKMIETVHNLGILRVEAVIKIDSRRDKHATSNERLESVGRYMD